MSYDAEGAVIRTRLNALWGNTTPVAWPNRSYTPTVGTSYIRLTIRNGEAFQPTLGASSAFERVPGVAFIEIFVPTDQRDSTARAYADSVAAIFRRARVGNLIFGTPSAREKANQDDTWYAWIVEAPYYREEVIGVPAEVALYGTEKVSQAGNGLVVGDWLKAASGTYAKAQADTSANVAWPAVVVEAGDPEFIICYLGKANLPAHGLGTAGTKIFLSQDTAGAATNSEPSSGLVQQLGTVIDADHVQVATWAVQQK